MQKSQIIGTDEIKVLFEKADRFLSKDSVKKEKAKIKGEIKAQFITGEGTQEGRVYIKDGVLIESEQSDDA